MARTLLDYMPVSKNNITKFLKNNFQNLSSYRILELVKNIPDEEERLYAFITYYDQISHGSFENSYFELFTGDNKFRLVERLYDKIFKKNIYIKLNDILNYFDNIVSKEKLIQTLKDKLNTLDDIDIKLIFSEIESNVIKLRLLDILNLDSKNKYAYYANYVNNESNEIKFNNLNKFGEIDFYNLDIVDFVKKIESDELKYNIIKKYFDIRNDINDIDITRLSMDLIKYIKSEEYRNNVVDLVKQRVHIENNNNQ